MSDVPELGDAADGFYETDYLLEQYVAGRLSAGEAVRLLELLRAEPALGQRLVDQVGVDAMLRGMRAGAEGAIAPVAQSAARGTVGPGRRSSRIRWAAAASLALAVTGSAAFWAARHRTGGRRGDGANVVTTTAPAAGEEPTTAAVAVLARTVEAVWADGRPREAGSPLEPGWLRLRSGLVEVEFYSGARVVLEGPGELQLRSASEAYCPAGRLSAEVPAPARGFRIGTPRGDVVDLGTAFGLDVSGSAGGGAAAAVHVFKGQVELHPSQQTMRGLKEGEAAAIGGDGQLRLFAADASAFTSPAVLERKAGEALGRSYAAWRAAGARWNADPDLVARLDFENIASGERALPNLAAGDGGRGAASEPATIIGCGRADGRWPGKGALEFRGVSDRVRLAVPGELTSFTYLMWVRVNGLDRRFNSLFMTDAFGAGATHWQVLSDGRVRLGVAGGGAGGRPAYADYDSPVAFPPERFGQWVHLAVAYDAAARRVTHYVDGHAVGSAPMRVDGPLRVGPAELGNWNPGARRDTTPIRHFSGRMDEFMIYRRALNEAEVRRVYAVDGPVGGP